MCNRCGQKTIIRFGNAYCGCNNSNTRNPTNGGFQLPSGGTDGDTLIKNGDDLIWLGTDRIINEYLHKSTLAEVRSITAVEIASLVDNTYKGVILYGYFSHGDTPNPIIYYKSNTILNDDQGSILQVANLKLEHKFSTCDLSYYGLQSEINTIEVVDRNTLVINNAIKISTKITITKPGKYWCRGNRGGEGGSYYRYDDNGDTTWWQVGDGDGQPGGINLLSNRTFEMGDNVTLKMRGTFMDAYNFITIWNKENVIIRGGTIIGDFDNDPTLNEHKRSDGTNDGGQWGYGISLQGSNNILIEDVNISKMWADGINLSPDYLHNYTINSNIIIKNTKSHHNRRQGMSIDGGSQLSFYGCEFSDTKGQDPQCGVDLERDTFYDIVQLSDVLFFDCKFLNNLIGARTAYKPTDKISVKFDNCLFNGNTSWDYDSYTANGVLFTNCRFAYKEDRFFSIELVGTQNHVFDKCTLNNAIRTSPRILDSVTYKCKNINFKNSICLDIKFNTLNLYPFFDLSNSVNFKIENCDFESLGLQDDRILVTSNGGENIEIINNTIRELGTVFDIKNINGFIFNDNNILNSLRITGVISGNVKYFEICNNTISGNSYFVSNALAPAFLIHASGNAYGVISNNILYQDPIFATLGAYTGACSGLYREYDNISDNIVVANNKLYGFTNTTGFQFNMNSTNLSVTYLNQFADITYKGIVNQSVTISEIVTADATDASTSQALVNELKAKLNTLIINQKAAGQIED